MTQTPKHKPDCQYGQYSKDELKRIEFLPCTCASKPSNPKEPAWESKLVDMIEKENYLATGLKSKEHFSGKCLVNDIIALVHLLLKKNKWQTAKACLQIIEDSINRPEAIYKIKNKYLNK